MPLGSDGWEVCSQEHISSITDSLKNVLLLYSNSNIKGTEIPGSILYLSLLRPPFLHVCNLEKTYYFPL